MIVFATLYPLVEGKKEVIALIPVMSDLRGDILGSSASRLNTILHLGLVTPSIYTLTKIELKPTLAISMVTGISMSIVSFIYTRMLGEPVNLEEMVSIGFLSSMIATLTLMPYIALIASEVFKRGFDPGNLLPTLVTTVGDLVTLPFLIVAFILVASTPSNITPLLFLTVTSISLAFYTASYSYGGSRIRRILTERLLILLLLTITEPLVGAFLAWLEEGLAEMRLIHLATSFIGVNGALASIAGVRLSATLHMYGIEGLTGRLTIIARDVALASIPGALLISLVGYTTQTLIGAHGTVGLIAMIAVVATATIVHIAIGLISALVVSIGSYKLGLDPNNVAIPVITTVMDITGIPILYITGLLVLS
ncbi:MAG: magnesium transporter [Desulfurococcales archaeon]|nr:magnesium transporter [Desulfurococcaceae archaeon]MCC6061164.1 magnesium transporter [Desulfurococcaceae archaeon]MDT7866748.1 magnesium transporter [Desulfurococcales archaeon]